MNDRSEPPAEGAGFLSRWSRRKAQVQDGRAVPAQALAPVALPAAGTVAAASPAEPGTAEPPRAAQQVSSPAPEAAPAHAPSPTLADVEKLTRDSDYAAFAARDVDPQVRNAAMKKLFHCDPHFNVMDGLDVYIDDYNQSEPLPRSIMRQMLQARALGLLDDELKEQDRPEPDEPFAEPQPAASRRPDEDPDLQLQPDDAAGREAAGAGPVDAGDAAPGGELDGTPAVGDNTSTDCRD